MRVPPRRDGRPRKGYPSLGPYDSGLAEGTSVTVADGLDADVRTMDSARGEFARPHGVLRAIGSPRGVLAIGCIATSVLGAWLLLVVLTPSVTRDELPRNPALRFVALFAFLLSALWLGATVRKIRVASLRLIAAVGLAGGIWFFLGGIADVDHLLINQYGWPKASHQYFHVSEVAAASAIVLAGLGVVLYRFWPMKRSLRIPLMGLFALFGSLGLLGNLVAAASFFRWTPYRDLVSIATHVPWAWNAAALGGIAIFVALLGLERLRPDRVFREIDSSAVPHRDEPPT